MYILFALLTACSPAVGGEQLTFADEKNIQSFETLSAVKIYENEMTGRYNVFETCPEFEGNFIFNKTNIDRNGHDYCQIGAMKKNEHSSTIFIQLVKCGTEGFPADDMEVTLSKNDNSSITFGGWWGYEPFSLFRCPTKRKQI